MKKTFAEMTVEEEIRYIAVRALALLIVIVAGGMAGCPVYNVWQKRLDGEAQLAEAESSRRIKIEEAKAAHLSADELAKAEVARAKGVAEANKIIGDSLRGNDAYLRYLWITSLTNDRGKEVIYVPTEANLPILEAQRLAPAAPQAPPRP